MAPLRIALIGHYPAASVLPERCLDGRHSLHDHPASWIRALGLALAARPEVSMRLFVLQRSVIRHCRTDAEGFETEFVPQFWPARWDSLFRYRLNALWLSRFIRRWKPDLVHGFGFETGDAVVASYLPCPRTGFMQGILETLDPMWLGHGRRAYEWKIRAAHRGMRRLNGVVVETQFAADWVRRIASSARIVAIPHALNPEFLSASAADPSKNSARFLFVGSLVATKGVDLLLQAARELKNMARFDIVGDGPERRNLRAMAKTLGVSQNCTFHGFKTRQDVISFMQNARALVVPSRADNSPNVITEAQALGLPVLASRVGGIPEMVEEGSDGILCPPEDARKLAEGLRRLAMDPRGAAVMGEKGRRKALLRHNPAAIADQHIEFWRRLCPVRGPASRFF